MFVVVKSAHLLFNKRYYLTHFRSFVKAAIDDKLTPH